MLSATDNAGTKDEMRSKVHVPRDADEQTVGAVALRDAAVQRLVEWKTIRKRIHVPNRLLNLVES